jgi:hypothetical protein
VRAKREPPIRAQLRETRGDVLVEAAGDACLETDLQQLAFLRQSARRDRVTAKQPKAELSLELSDLLRERGLGHPQALGGRRKVQLLCDRREVSEVAQVHAHSH